MTNLTITIDEETLRRARIRALERGTSVNAVLRDYLESFAGTRSAQSAAIDSILDRSHRVNGRRGGRTWTRDELHER
jgi:plasmid stability protein